MISKETIKKLDDLYVAGPDHAGALYPKFDPEAINESKIPYGMRFKSWNIDKITSEEIRLTWESQSEFDGTELAIFKGEVSRAISNHLKKNESIEVYVHAYDRDGFGSMNINFVVNGTL